MRRAVFLMALMTIANPVTARADNYVMPELPMDAQSVANVSQAVAQVISVGTYTGKTASGELCSVTVSSGGNPTLFIPELDINGDLDLAIYPSSSDEFQSYLLGLFVTSSSQGLEEQIQLGVETDREEAQAQDIFVTIAGKNGVPSSIQFGLTYSGNGGGSGLYPGQVVPSSDIDRCTDCRVCSGLVKSQ